MRVSISGISTERIAGFLAASDQVDARLLVEQAYDLFGDRLALSTSFGVHSAVMIHLVTRVVPEIPVIWIDTGYLFADTYRFAEEVTQRFKLNLKVFQAHLSAARMEALFGRLWESRDKDEMDRYDFVRKVEPMRRALRELNVEAWIAGLRSEQTEYRRTLSRVHRWDEYFKILPVLSWSSGDMEDYISEHNLPVHPLHEKGYVSIGDWHSSRPVRPDDRRDRDTRFNGVKQECGLHLDLSEAEAISLDSSKL